MVRNRARTEHATVPDGGHSLRTTFFHANSIVAFFPQSLHTRVLAIQAHITPTIAVNVSHFGSKTAQSPGTGCHKAPPPTTSPVKTEKHMAQVGGELSRSVKILQYLDFGSLSRIRE